VIRFTLLFGLCSVAGCIQLPVASRPRAAAPVPASYLESVAYSKPDDLVVRATPPQTNSPFNVRRVEIRSATRPNGNDRILALDCYTPNKVKPAPVILILPIIGGNYPLEQHFARYFARHGMAAVLVRRDKLLKGEQFDQIDGLLRQATIDARQALDWIEAQPEYDPSRIGLFGVSMGAIRGALLLPAEPRIRAATLGLVGGDIPWILAHTEEPGIAKRRRALMEKESISQHELEERLRSVVTLDPMAVASSVDPRKVFLVLATCDTSVPIRKGWELRRLMGKPETMVVFGGHYSALLYIPCIKVQTLQFFREKFAEPQRK
jgi:hypothetical protein